ncbi:MAG: GHKL domain-containing protein [Salinivirgaceae bacterium]|nr:GHKL domain-containing protein [Salinivirgaceae bacterium]
MKLFNVNIFRNSNLKQIRLQLVYAILFILISLGLPIIIIASIEAHILHQFFTILVYLIFFIPIVIVTIFRKRLNYKLIAGTVIVFGFILALSNVITYGFGGAGIPIFFSLFALTTIFFSQRAGLFLILLSSILMCIIGYLYITQKIALDVSLDAISTKTISWLTAMAVLVLLGGVIVFSIGLIQSKMMQSIQLAHKKAEQLKEANLRLTKDVQRRIITEKKLQISEKLLIDAQHIAKLGNWEYITQTSNLLVSKECYYILELEDNIPSNQLFNHIINRIQKYDLIEYKQIIQTAIIEGESFTLSSKYVFNNFIKYIDCVGKPIKDKFGEIVGFQGIINDITEHKQNEEKIKELNANLEETIKTRTHEIIAKNKDLAVTQKALVNIVEDLNEKSNQLEEITLALQSANKELEAFSYSVSHDLKAPLRAITGFAQILNEDYGSDLSLEAKRYIRLIKDNAENMGVLINDLLSFSRLGRKALQISQVNMTDVISRVKDELKEEIKDRKLSFKILPMPFINADESLMYHVMINLISNAVKFTSKIENAKLEIGCKSKNNENVYFVKDNGIGFDMKYADKIFDVFQRLHSSDEFPGTGIGLSIVQRIIYKHNGKIWVQSEKNKGTTFFFTI